ncbi:MAG: hypothetical protein ABJD07_16550, partial [Gemmatimonadaceae bacterium]
MTTPQMPESRGPGGTPGGMGTFLLGAALVVGGGYLLLNQVTVSSSVWTVFGVNGFGLSLIPLVLGIGILFYNGRSLAGWILTGAGAVIIAVGIIT